MADDPNVIELPTDAAEIADGEEGQFHSFAEKDYKVVAAAIDAFESTPGAEEKIIVCVRE
jgi:hypothetical protein